MTGEVTPAPGGVIDQASCPSSAGWQATHKQRVTQAVVQWAVAQWWPPCVTYLCRLAPQHEHDIVELVQLPDDGRRELLPALLLVRRRLTLLDGEHVIEQEHSLQYHPSQHRGMVSASTVGRHAQQPCHTCFAHDSSEPCVAALMPTSAWASLIMLRKLGGIRTPFCTEKHKPCACAAQITAAVSCWAKGAG